MTTLKAARCDNCGETKPIRFGSHPDDWIIVFGAPDNAQLDFCRVGCLAIFFHPHFEFGQQAVEVR